MLQSVGLLLLFGLFRILPVPWASTVGGAIGRNLGPLTKPTKRARHNLSFIFPERSEPEITGLLREMWDNLGRVMGEYPHLRDFAYGESRRRIELVGAANLEKARNAGRPVIFFSGHLANWEMSPIAATQHGAPLHLVYRAPNQPVARRLVEWIRTRSGSALLPKGRTGARDMVQEIKRNGRIGILVDQKLNEGIAVPFLDRPAMTSTAVAELSMKYEAITVPARVERLGGCNFRVTVYAPLTFERTGDRAHDVRVATEYINEIVGGWIRERPGQWLWLHRRWPESGRPVTTPGPQSMPGQAASETS